MANANVTITDGSGPKIVPTLEDIRDLLRAAVGRGTPTGPNSVSQFQQQPGWNIMSPAAQREAVDDRSRQLRSGRIDTEAAGRAIPQLLRGDLQGAFNTRAQSAASQASLAGDGLKAESILGGASKLNAAFAIASAAAEVGAQGLKAFRGGVEQAGEQARRVAGNDYLGALNASVEGAAGALEKIPVVGKLAGEGLRAAIAPVNEFAKTVEAFVQRGRELARYDAGLAAAAARADTRRTLADIDEAGRLSDSISRLSDAQSGVEEAFREVMLPIKQLLAELLADVAEPVADLIQILKPFIVTVVELLKTLVDIARKLNPLGQAGDFLKALRGVNDPGDGQLNTLMQRVLGAGDAAPGIAPPRGGRAAEVEAALAGMPPAFATAK